MKLHELIPNDKEILFACIGTDRSTGDCVGPLVGTWLQEKGHTVVGTLNDPLHALNLVERMEWVERNYPNHFVVAIDACLGKYENIGKVLVEEGPLQPGKAVKKNLPPVGNISIKAVVNVSGFMEYTLLQSTRLNVVWDLAKEIAEMCDKTMKYREQQMLNEVASC